MSFLDPRAVRDWCRQKFLAKDDVLKTKDTVEANTEEGKAVDALVIKEVFQSVSDGKELIASAITDKGVNTDATDTFEVMAGNIGQIESEGGDFPIKPPYHFIFESYQIPFSTGSGSFTIPFPFKLLKRMVVTKVYMYLNKSSSSNSSGSFYVEILGKKAGASAATTIKSWSGALSQSKTSSLEQNITIETEIDLNGYESVESFRVTKNASGGTVVSILATIKFEADLYF